MKTKKYYLQAFGLLLMLFFGSLAVLLSDINSRFKLSQPEYYLLKSGSSVTRLGYELKERGLIRYPRMLAFYSKLTGSAARLKAGEYILDEYTTAKSLLDRMVSGDVILHSITLIEGWTFKQALNEIKQNAYLVKTLDYDQDVLQISSQLGYQGVHPEGNLLPETYSFPRGTTDVEFLKRAWQAMDKVITEEWQQRAPSLPLRSPYEALTLASIIEKETGNESERTLISSVFINRLRKGMPLGTDPTIIYGLGDEFDGDLTFKHLRTDTPYNTRTRRGLPPTPIAMPGRASIHAALHPDQSEMLYFVAQGDQGKHYFSKTLQEHEAAVDRYQRKRRSK